MYEGHELSQAAAEILLRSGTGGPPALQALLRAAAAPATEAELTGQHHALVAFRSAHLGSPARSIPRSRKMIQNVFAQVAAAKLAAGAAVAAAASGGIALAAATGAIPSPMTHPTPHKTVAHAAASAEATESAEPSSAASSDAATTSADASEASTSASASTSAASSAAAAVAASTSHEPTPDLTGLCTAYQAKEGHDSGKSLDSAAFTVLVNTAGGKDNVGAYCVTLIGARPSHGNDASDEASGDSSDSEGARPSSTPTRKPESRPSSAPTRETESHTASAPTSEASSSAPEPSSSSESSAPSASAVPGAATATTTAHGHH